MVGRTEGQGQLYKTLVNVDGTDLSNCLYSDLDLWLPPFLPVKDSSVKWLRTQTLEPDCLGLDSSSAIYLLGVCVCVCVCVYATHIEATGHYSLNSSWPSFLICMLGIQQKLIYGVVKTELSPLALSLAHRKVFAVTISTVHDLSWSLHNVELHTRLVWKWSPGGLSALRQLEITRPPASWIQRDGGGTPCLPPTPLTPKVSISNRAASLLELLVLGAPRLGQEALCQLLQVAGVVHLDLSLLTEEVLEVLQQLYPELTLLVQAFHLLRELSADLCNESKRRQSDRHLWKKPRCQHSPLPSRCSLCSGELKGFTFKNVMRGTTTNSPTFQTLKEYWNRESAKSVKKKLLIRHMILRAAF